MAQALTLKDVSPKLRIVKPRPPKDDVGSTEAYQTTRVTALEDGINLNRQDGGLIQYADMSMMVVFQLDSDPDTWYLELFVYGQNAPFRISQKAINYRQFLPKLTQRSKDNFFTFLLGLINQTDSIYVDEQTLAFLKSQKIASFPDFKYLEEYTKQLWFQLIAWMKFQCDQCGEVYWVDDSKITSQGAKTKCVKCQNIIMVKRREKPIPLKSKEERPVVICPHCQYENSQGAQFCIMCQQSLVATTSPLPSSSPQISQKKSSKEPEPPQTAPVVLAEDRDKTGSDRERRKPRYSFREIALALKDDIHTLENKFAWFTTVAAVMKIAGFAFFFAGMFVGIYIRFVYPSPLPPAAFPTEQRWAYFGISAGVGLLLSLACLVASNLIALNLEIEQNTKITTLLLQKLVEKDN